LHLLISFEQSIFAQGTLLFQVGESQQPFHLHTALVADCSPFLKALMTGQMKEAQENTVNLPDIDALTFARFAEYIYRGNYNVPVPAKIKHKKASLDLVDDVKAVQTSASAPLSLPNRRKVAQNQGPPKPSVVKYESFSDFPLASGTFETFPSILEPFFVDKNFQQDFSELIQCHAHVYVMADYLQAQNLKDLAIRKMHKTMEYVMQSEKRCIKNIASILKYSYENTMHLESSKDRLRDLLTLYVAWDFRSVMDDEGFRASLKTSNAFMVDISEKICLRLQFYTSWDGQQH
jgi:BTB/POZ domain